MFLIFSPIFSPQLNLKQPKLYEKKQQKTNNFAHSGFVKSKSYQISTHLLPNKIKKH